MTQGQVCRVLIHAHSFILFVRQQSLGHEDVSCPRHRSHDEDEVALSRSPSASNPGHRRTRDHRDEYSTRVCRGQRGRNHRREDPGRTGVEPQGLLPRRRCSSVPAHHHEHGERRPRGFHHGFKPRKVRALQVVENRRQHHRRGLYSLRLPLFQGIHHPHHHSRGHRPRLLHPLGSGPHE